MHPDPFNYPSRAERIRLLLEQAQRLSNPLVRGRPSPPSLTVIEGDGKSTKRRAKLEAAR